MRHKKIGFIFGFLLFAVIGALLSCASDRADLKLEASLSDDQLAYYNDSFDSMREDLWEKVGLLYRKEQVRNFKLADMRFENGKLIIHTRTGSFSKGGLSSKYALRGNFDIQLDCRMHFVEGIPGWDMDQVFNFAVVDKSKKIGKMTIATIGLSMRGGRHEGYLFSNCFVDGKKRGGHSEKIQTSGGTFRILRRGKNISMLFREEDKPEWIQMTSLHASNNDMLVAFQVRNFVNNRTTISANYPVIADLDNFKINAAREIIEEEI